jgi:hypothetical protein
VRRTLPLFVLCLLAACGGGPSSTLLSSPSPTGSPSASPSPDPIPSFATPQEAMIYLADAWNRLDIVSLKHVTDPAARSELDAMHREATNLRLDSCKHQPAGDYECTFTHDFPPGYKHTQRVGKAAFLVGPARRSGWYMTVFEYCGDGGGG